MSDIPPALEVHCFDRIVGVLRQERGLEFAYDASWAADGLPPLSQSLPVGPPLRSDTVRAFFSGLLPEGLPRATLARELGISEANDYALLAALGGDCPGAISLYPSGTDPSASRTGGEITWLDDEGLAALVRELPRRPMFADAEGEIRLSLAGVHDKLPVVVDSEGRVGVTKGRLPSTHILKMPIPGFEGTIENEAFCLALGRRLGLPTVEAVPRATADVAFLMVTRYDRTRTDDGVMRLHQEDLCQALGIAPERKYENEGGPSLETAFQLVRRAATVPGTQSPVLLDGVVLNYLVGNHDAHGKNYSLLYSPDHVGLAPFYDIISTEAYRSTKRMSRKMAMKIGGEYRADWVEARHLTRLLEAARLGPAAARARIRRLAGAAPEAARQERESFREDGWEHPILDRVLNVIDARAERLLAITRAAGVR
jgi:serine/threonine-protein kinase HipA